MATVTNGDNDGQHCDNAEHERRSNASEESSTAGLVDSWDDCDSLDDNGEIMLVAEDEKLAGNEKLAGDDKLAEDEKLAGELVVTEDKMKTDPAIIQLQEAIQHLGQGQQKLMVALERLTEAVNVNQQQQVKETPPTVNSEAEKKKAAAVKLGALLHCYLIIKN
jgi:hypothetical protein